MTSLYVNNFSCLKDVYIELMPVNIIIGPQGTGKSVTTKLLYFFSNVLSQFGRFAERGESFEAYKRHISREFNTWFPLSAWGNGRFKIIYSTGSFTIRVLRRINRGQPTDEVSITFSDWFSDFYQKYKAIFENYRASDILDVSSNNRSIDFDEITHIYDAMYKSLSEKLENGYIYNQTFIPAGRAFFTSIGRLVAALEQIGSLDPITIQFARLYARVRDFKTDRVYNRLSQRNENLRELRDKRNDYIYNFFGGEIKFEHEAEYIHTKDGRRIPFSIMSSGQQELMPMWSVMDYINARDATRANSLTKRQAKSRKELIFIEEPEAHLFPSAQSLLMEYLIGNGISENSLRNLIITTHSPYIMSKLNVFLKAGQLARRKKKNQDINKIVPRECWLDPNQLSAYAIEEGRLRQLIDDDGLIDGSYLDNVSEDMSKQFSQLLKIESEM